MWWRREHLKPVSFSVATSACAGKSPIEYITSGSHKHGSKKLPVLEDLMVLLLYHFLRCDFTEGMLPKH